MSEIFIAVVLFLVGIILRYLFGLKLSIVFSLILVVALPAYLGIRFTSTSITVASLVTSLVFFIPLFLGIATAHFIIKE